MFGWVTVTDDDLGIWSKFPRATFALYKTGGAGGLMGHVNKVSHVFTLSHVAEMLGEDEEWLFEVGEEMDTEDGQLWVVGVGEDGVMAFTDDGIENPKS
jgi:hypothetical protein